MELRINKKNLIVFILSFLTILLSIYYIANRHFELHDPVNPLYSALTIWIFYLIFFLFPIILNIKKHNLVVVIIFMISFAISLLIDIDKINHVLVQRFFFLRIIVNNLSDIHIYIILVIIIITLGLMITDLFKDNKLNLFYKIYLFSIVAYAIISFMFVGRFNSFGNRLLIDIGVLYPSELFYRLSYLFKQDIIFYAMWLYLFIYNQKNFFIEDVNVKHHKASTFLLFWFFLGMFGGDRIYLRNKHNLANFQILSSTVILAFIIPNFFLISANPVTDFRFIRLQSLYYMDLILFFVLVLLLIGKLMLWVYSLVDYLKLSNVKG